MQLREASHHPCSSEWQLLWGTSHQCSVSPIIWILQGEFWWNLTFKKRADVYISARKDFSQHWWCFWKLFTAAKGGVYRGCAVSVCQPGTSSITWEGTSPEALWGIFLTNDRYRRAKSSLGSTTPGQVALGCIRKQAEQAMAIEPVTSIPPWLLLSFLPWLPIVMDCELEVYNKPSPTPRLFRLGVYHSNREAN